MPQRYHASSAGMDDGEITRCRRGDVRRDEKVVRVESDVDDTYLSQVGLRRGASVRLLGVERDSKKEARGTMTPRYHASSA